VWTREYIESLDEKALCLEVLIPVFTAMGYRDVDFTGGGILEQGKDIVMWKPSDLRDRMDYAVVVKAERISGKTETGTVLTQIRECFGSPYEDKSTHEPRQINHCFVVTSQAILKEGTHTLGSLLRSANLTPHVTAVDGDRLWRMVCKYLPARVAASTIADAYKALSPSDETANLEVVVNEKGTLLVVEPKSGAAFEVKGVPAFSETQSGRTEKAAFDEFLRTGQPVEISGESLAGLELPKAMRDLLEVIGIPERVRFSRRAPEPLEFELEIEGPAGSFRLPHVSFSSVEGGSESVTLRNDGQPLPFKLSVTIRRDLRASLRYQFQFQGESVEWLLRHLEFSSAAVPGAILRLRSHRTLEVFESTFTQELDGGHQFGPEYQSIVEKAVSIQRKTRRLIRVPDRAYFTTEDIEGIDRAVELLETGRARVAGEIATTLRPDTSDPQASARLLAGGFDLALEKAEWALRVLDDVIDVGTASIDSRRLRIHPDDHERVRRELESGAEEISCRLTTTGGGYIEVTLPKWAPDGGKGSGLPPDAK
jgi:hypothetical protein